MKCFANLCLKQVIFFWGAQRRSGGLKDHMSCHCRINDIPAYNKYPMSAKS